jgi:hypothetical protein
LRAHPQLWRISGVRETQTDAPAPQAVVAPHEINQPISWFERGRGALKVQIKINNMGDYRWNKIDEIVEAQGNDRYTEIRYCYRQIDR